MYSYLLGRFSTKNFWPHTIDVKNFPSFRFEFHLGKGWIKCIKVNIDTKLGNLDVLHVAKFNYQSPERIDLWLAKKYGYLPVKISITEDDLSTVIQKIETLKIKKINE